MTNTKGGKGHRKAKSGSGLFRRELIYKEFGQEYAKITKMLGNGHCECTCIDEVVRLGNIRGKMRKRVWLSVGDTVLVGLREYQDNKVDIIHKYTPDEVRNLQSMGELPQEDHVEEEDDEQKDVVVDGENIATGIDIDTI